MADAMIEHEAASGTALTLAIRPGVLRSHLRLSREAMARLLETSTKSLERWEATGSLPVNPRQRARLVIIRDIIDLGLRVYTPDGLAEFVRTPLPTFGYRTALQLIQGGEAERALAALIADYDGLGF